MHRPLQRRLAALAAPWAATVLAAACAGGALRYGPQDVTRLEAAHAAAPTDQQVATDLGIAYYRAERPVDAERVLQSAIDNGSRDPLAFLHLGLAREAQLDYLGAREAYEQYLRHGTSRIGRGRVEQRLAVISRAALRLEARAMVAREQEISPEPPLRNSIAVFPFMLVGGSPELEPLQTAFAEMIVTDLALTGRLESVERIRVTSLLDEMVLAQAGLVEESTGARAGRMLRAEHVAQGLLDLSTPQRLVVQGVVLETEQQRRRGELAEGGGIDDVFEIQKQTVFAIFDRLGIELTPAERERIGERGTRNLLAFLSFGRGLDALDGGRFHEAADHFRDATRHDPGFQAARVQFSAATHLSTAAYVTPDVIEGAAVAEAGPPEPGSAVGGTPHDLLQQTNDLLNPSPAQELASLGSTNQQTGDKTTGTTPTNTGEPNPPPLGGSSTATINIRVPRPPGN